MRAALDDLAPLRFEERAAFVDLVLRFAAEAARERAGAFADDLLELAAGFERVREEDDFDADFLVEPVGICIILLHLLTRREWQRAANAARFCPCKIFKGSPENCRRLTLIRGCRDAA
jgi:hypothetical protein